MLNYYCNEPRINWLIQKYPPERCVLLVRYGEVQAVVKPWLDNLLSNPAICTSWVENEMQDILPVHDVDMLRFIATEHGFDFVAVELLETGCIPSFYEPSAS